MADDREPDAGYLSFKGDLTKSFNMNIPSRRDDHKIVWPVSIEYNEEKNKTRIGYSTQVPAHMLQGRDD